MDLVHDSYGSALSEIMDGRCSRHDMKSTKKRHWSIHWAVEETDYT